MNVCTYTNQSIAQRRETSWYGASMAVNTMSMRTRAALGTLAAAMEVAVEVSTTVTRAPASSSMSFIWAMKMEATVTKMAVPSMFTVAPIGRTNLEILSSTLLLFFMQRKVTGRAAALQAKRDGYLN